MLTHRLGRLMLPLGRAVRGNWFEAGPVAEIIAGRGKKPHSGFMSSPGPLGRAFPSVSGSRKEFGNRLAPISKKTTRIGPPNFNA